MSNCVNLIEIWGRRYSERIPGGVLYYWDAEYYTYKHVPDDATVRDERHTDEVIETLLGKSSQWRNETPVVADDFVPWFTVALSISDTRRSKSHYAIDYHKHANCPLGIITLGMDIYRLIKRNIKRAKKRGQAK
jgi:hypothetical protein